MSPGRDETPLIRRRSFIPHPALDVPPRVPRSTTLYLVWSVECLFSLCAKALLLHSSVRIPKTVVSFP
jgi:hypothetical protein